MTGDLPNKISGNLFWSEFYGQNPAKNSSLLTGKSFELFQELLTAETNSFLKSMSHRLQKGKALDLGTGNAQNAFYLAENEFETLSIDYSDKVIEMAEEESKKRTPQKKITFKKTDIELHIFGLLQFDTVVMTYYHPTVSRIYDEIVRSLKHGGTLLIESFLVDETPEILGPEDSYKNLYYKPNEILKNLGDLRILFYQEGMIHGRQRVQCLAQKPLDKDIQKYNLFNMSNPDKKLENKNSIHIQLAESLFKKKE